MVIEELSISGYEKVIKITNDDVGLKAFISIHNTVLGPALGGCRIWPFQEEEKALNDVLRLSKAMTYKNSLAGLNFGGGKSVIMTDNKTPELLEEFAKAVESLNGKYIVAEDVGSTVDDMLIFASVTDHVCVDRSNNISEMTALGVFEGIKASVFSSMNLPSLQNVRVAVQGLGKVGMTLCDQLRNSGAYVYVADINSDAVDYAVEHFEVEEIDVADIHMVDCDVFAPCALGGVLDLETISELSCHAVCGSANNQLAQPNIAAELKEAGILYAPDYLVNAGGVMWASHCLKRHFDPNYALENIRSIHDKLLDVYQLAEESNSDTDSVANYLAKERIGHTI